MHVRPRRLPRSVWGKICFKNPVLPSLSTHHPCKCNLNSTLNSFGFEMLIILQHYQIIFISLKRETSLVLCPTLTFVTGAPGVSHHLLCRLTLSSGVCCRLAGKVFTPQCSHALSFLADNYECKKQPTENEQKKQVTKTEQKTDWDMKSKSLRPIIRDAFGVSCLVLSQ